MNEEELMSEVKYCKNCKGIPVVDGEDYCLDCLKDMEKMQEDENGNEQWYRFCPYCKKWFLVQNGHRCW